MPARMTTIPALMIAVLVVAVVLGGSIAAEAGAPRDFPVIFRIALFEGIIALILLVVLLRVIPRDAP